MKKSQMSNDFDTKHMLRCADGGMVKAVGDLRGARERAIDEAVNGKPAAKPAAPAQPEAKPEFDDASIGIRIPKQPAAKPAAEAPKKKGLLGLGIMGLRSGGKVSGPGGPTDDKVPAMLSDGEFVMPADSVEKIGAHKLEALRRATHTPVKKMANGGLLDDEEFGRASPPPLGDDPNRSSAGLIRTAAFQAPLTTTAGPSVPTAPRSVPGYQENASQFVAANSMPNPQALRQTAYPSNLPPAAPAAGTPATGDFNDARDLRLANQRSGQYDKALDTVNAMDNAMRAPGTEGIQRQGNTFFGKGSADPADRTIDIANASAKAEMQRMDAAKEAKDNAAFARQGAGIQQAIDFANQYDARIANEKFQQELRNPHLTKSAKNRLIAVRGQDQQLAAAQAGHAVQSRGQDLSAETSRRGQDLTAGTAAAERDVQTRGQDLSALSNQALRNLQAKQFERQITQQDRQYGLDQQRVGLEGQREGRAARQEGLKNFNDQVQLAATELKDGKPQVNPEKVANITDKVNYTMQQMGISAGDIPTELHAELIRRAAEMSDREEASKGLPAFLAGKLTGRGVKASRDLRDANATGFEPGAIFDNVQTGAGEISTDAFTRGKFGVLPDFDKLPNKQKQQQLEELAKKLRSPR